MGLQSLLVFESVIDGAVAPAWREIAGGRIHIIGCRPDEPGITTERTGADEVDYCRASARVEIRRAGEAVHPAACNAHLEMAALYRQRAVAALQVGEHGARGWASEIRRPFMRA